MSISSDFLHAISLVVYVLESYDPSSGMT